MNVWNRTSRSLNIISPCISSTISAAELNSKLTRRKLIHLKYDAGGELCKYHGLPVRWTNEPESKSSLSYLLFQQQQQKYTGPYRKTMLRSGLPVPSSTGTLGLCSFPKAAQVGSMHRLYHGESNLWLHSQITETFMEQEIIDVQIEF